MADIWASQEEMEYEQNLEGTIDQQLQRKHQNEPYVPRWKRYKKSAQSQKERRSDPCCPNAAGYGDYRNTDQIKRQSKEVALLQGEQNEHAARSVAKNSSEMTVPERQRSEMAVSPSTYSMQQQVWYYQDNTSGAIQGPFSGQQMMSWRAFFPVMTPVRFGSGGEFAAMGDVDFINLPLTVPPPPQSQLSIEMTGGMLAIDETIVAAENDVSNRAQTLPESQNRIMPPLTVKDDGEPQPASEAGDPEIGMCVPPVLDDEDTTGTNVDINCFPEAGDNSKYNDASSKKHGEVDLCIPPPSDEEDKNEDIPYPLPSDDDDAVPYPVDVEYPVNNDSHSNQRGEMASVTMYPTDTNGTAFAVSTAVHDVHNQTLGKDAVMPPPKEEKKKYEGDRAVVGFIPTNLKVKRKTETLTKKPLRKMTPTTMRTSERQQASATTDNTEERDEGKGVETLKGKYSVADDYTKFMEEISKL